MTVVPVRALPILMAVRIKGRATLDAIATAAGVTVHEARPAVTAACAAGLVQAVTEVPARPGHDPAEGTFALTAGGQAELGALLARERRDPRALVGAYEAFLVADARLKAAITGWQLATPGARVEQGVALCDTGVAAAAALDCLVALMPRYVPYRHRLGGALAALRAGDERYAASPRVDSLHQVWFELHQDLLLTLGRERGT